MIYFGLHKLTVLDFVVNMISYSVSVPVSAIMHNVEVQLATFSETCLSDWLMFTRSLSQA